MVAATSSSTAFRQDIQGLRALAVLLVIADHAGARWLSGGFVGVDVFFVISGYLITLLLVREAASTGRVRIGAFYARRARRILPAASLVIVATMAFAARELSLSRVHQLHEDGVWSAAFAANIHFARLRTDYFAQGPDPSPFQHYWSLAVEEQFYLLWPLLLALLLIVVARRSASSVTRTRALTWLLVVIIAASLTSSMRETSGAPGLAYYSSPARAWELAVGALVAVQEPRLASWERGIRWALGTAGFLAIGTAAVSYGAGSAFPGWRALLPVLGTAALVAAGVAAQTGPSRVLTLAPLPWLGALSYSLYLWHWPVLVLGPDLSHRLTGARGTALLLVVTLTAAVATYYLVENPVRRASVLRHGRRALVLWPVTVGVVLLSVLAAEQHSAALLQARMTGSLAVQASLPRAVKEGTGRHGHEARPTPSQPSLAQRLADALRLADSGAKVALPLTNLPSRPHVAFPQTSECRADPPETSTGVCPIGQVDAKQTLVVFGDSQAGEWLPAIDRLGEREGLRVLPLIKLGCPPFDVPVVDGGGADYWQCSEFRRWATSYIANVHPRVVIVGSEATSDRLRTRPGLDLHETWAAGVASLVNRLRQQGPRVMVMPDTPDLAFDPVDCLTAPDSRLGDCVGAPHEGLAAANAITRDVATQGGAGFLDTVSLLCLHGRCPTVVDNTMTFMDYAHVDAAWSAALVGDFDRLYRGLATGAGHVGQQGVLRSFASSDPVHGRRQMVPRAVR